MRSSRATSSRVGDVSVTAREAVPAGHKVALRALARRAKSCASTAGRSGERRRRSTPAAGSIRTTSGRSSRARSSTATSRRRARERPRRRQPRTWEGYRRADGRVGTRNEVWVINTVGCVNWAAEKIARSANERFAGVIDGVHAFAHPYGCSQLGDDLRHTRQVLAGLMRHPNAGGVLVLGLGCENNQLDALLAEAGDVDRSRIRVLQHAGRLRRGARRASPRSTSWWSACATIAERRCPCRRLVLGHKCGGSDGFSGITANPLVGRIADRLTAARRQRAADRGARDVRRRAAC